jgi:hypothetical protein
MMYSILKGKGQRAAWIQAESREVLNGQKTDG